jgi:hypothetical protein
MDDESQENEHSGLEPCYMGDGKIKWTPQTTKAELNEPREQSRLKQREAERMREVLPLLNACALREKYDGLISGNISKAECLKWYKATELAFITQIRLTPHDKWGDYKITIAEYKETITEIRRMIALIGLTPDTQAPEADGKAQSGDPVKQTLQWLKSKQYITLYTEGEKPALKNGAFEYIEPSKKEWRISKTKTAAFVYRELCGAAENGQIPLAIDAIPDFMINNLKQKNGEDVTKNAIEKAAKLRQTSPNSA